MDTSLKTQQWGQPAQYNQVFKHVNTNGSSLTYLCFTLKYTIFGNKAIWLLVDAFLHHNQNLNDIKHVDNKFIYNKLIWRGGGTLAPMRCNEVGSSIYIKVVLQVTKFEAYHGNRNSQDKNKKCHAFSTAK
jgi:hypothetical protein